jgi:hypothetical protein
MRSQGPVVENSNTKEEVEVIGVEKAVRFGLPPITEDPGVVAAG